MRRRERERLERSRLPPTPPPTAPNDCATSLPSPHAPGPSSARHTQVPVHSPLPSHPPLPTPRPTAPSTTSGRRSAAQRRRQQPERQEEGETPQEDLTDESLLPVIVNASRQGLKVRMADGRLEPIHSIARRPYQEPAARHDLGSMNIECPDCGALHWDLEKLSTSTLARPKFGMCCDSGQVRLPPLRRPPDVLYKLFTEETTRAKEFRDNIWKYNWAFAFTSLQVREDHSINNGRGPPVFRIFGELCHRGGPLEPRQGQRPTYAQLYIYDPQEALDNQAQMNADLNPNTLRDLQSVIIRSNQYVQVFEHAWEVMNRQGNGGAGEGSVSVALRPAPDQPGIHQRRRNLPTASEVAVIICDSNGEEPRPRDIVLHLRGGGLYHISDLHPAYTPLYYVLLFPYSEPGWHPDLQMHRPDSRPHRISQSRFVAYRLQVRRNEFSTILRSKRLLQRYLVDMYATIDQNRLRFLRHNQPKLRASVYSGLQDALSAADEEVDLNQLGQKVILPSSYIGGPRHMQQRYQDAMALARYFRRCDVFLTITCNPNWDEITRELEPGQTAYDRPDLVARVFQMKKDALLDYITKHGILGDVVAYVYAIEFQKRSLPHAHILIFFGEGSKVLTPADIESCISAEWPDPNTQPRLFETVKRCMVHGPCGPMNPNAPCMEDGRCTKGYPKEFSDSTMFDESGFPQYKRRNDGRQFEVGGFMLDNRWIIPHPPMLCALFDCHINLESVASAASFKYLFKYVHKGGDLAGLEVSRDDEITHYLSGRYVSACEAVHRIFHFEMHGQVPNIVRLAVHLPGQHMVVFNPDEDPQEVLSRARDEKTTLTAWFNANSDEGPLGDLARQYAYQDFPQHFTWKEKDKKWDLRQRGFALGRMYFVGPTAGERFYLRLLLTVVKGARTFADLRTFQEVTYETFHAACLARGLLEDDSEWRECLAEACEMQIGSRLRRLFATIMVYCTPAQPEVLWEEFWRKICDDIPLQLRQIGHLRPNSDEIVQDYGLHLLNEVLKEMGCQLNDWRDMPKPRHDWSGYQLNPLIVAQLEYDHATQRRLLEQRLPQLNEDQLSAYDAIIDSVTNNRGKVFFVNGPGGTGKMFLYNTICNKLRSNGDIVLCVAYSGIAALLLPGGRTAHSTFQIPIDILSDSICSFGKQTNRAHLMRATKAIIWDEIGAQHRHCVEAVDRTLRDMRDNDKPFGGLTVVLGGDFQQTLPVVRRGSREEVVDATLIKSRLWGISQVFHLRRNMRVRDDPEATQFAQWLLDVGHGRNMDGEGKVHIPEDMRARGFDELVHLIYDDISRDPPPPPKYFLDRMILAPRNVDVADSNQHVLNCMSGNESVFFSADQVIDSQGNSTEEGNIPPEYLRALDATNFPPGELHLKVGCPVILLRNISSAAGLCNGTRLIVRRMSMRVLEVQLIGGDHDGDVVLIPRISLIPQESVAELPFRIRRRQFPVRLAFSLTINKAQGQSVKYVGLDLRSPVFSHGQLYVALSRATCRANLRVLTPNNGADDSVLNVVYPDVLLD